MDGKILALLPSRKASRSATSRPRRRPNSASRTAGCPLRPCARAATRITTPKQLLFNSPYPSVLRYIPRNLVLYQGRCRFRVLLHPNDLTRPVTRAPASEGPTRCKSRSHNAFGRSVLCQNPPQGVLRTTLKNADTRSFNQFPARFGIEIGVLDEEIMEILPLLYASDENLEWVVDAKLRRIRRLPSGYVTDI